MTEAHKIPWKRLAVEAVAIVASILLAFTIDAWWEEVQSDRDVRQILGAVRSEMQSNLEALELSIAHHEEIYAAIITATDNSSVDGLHRVVLVAREKFEPRTDALDTMVATGLISAVDDGSTRISLSAFAGLAQDYRERESSAAQFRDAARRRLAAIGEPIWIPERLVNSLTDVHMLNLLMMRAAEEEAAIEAAWRLKDHISKMLSQLESSP